MYTQQELESKSDFELSEMILKIEAKKDGAEISNTSKHRLSGKLKAFRNVVIFDVDADGVNAAGHVDYCNNWSDMGPLIKGHGIALQLVDCRDEDSAWLASTHIRGGSGRVSIIHDNPLRAAAIVYLLGGE